LQREHVTRFPAKSGRYLYVAPHAGHEISVLMSAVSYYSNVRRWPPLAGIVSTDKYTRPPRGAKPFRQRGSLASDTRHKPCVSRIYFRCPVIAYPAGGPYHKVPPPRGLLLPGLPAVPRKNGFANEALSPFPPEGREASVGCQGLPYRRWLLAFERLLSPTGASRGPVHRADAETGGRRTRECPQAAGLGPKYARC
jgi:hypothetical protein